MTIFKTATIATLALLTAQAGAVTPLAPGKPAGIHKAQIGTDVLIPLGISIGAVVGIVAATSNAGSLPAAPTITTTGTSG